jgi:parallel beta-helix repeat protein
MVRSKLSAVTLAFVLLLSAAVGPVAAQNTSGKPSLALAPTSVSLSKGSSQQMTATLNGVPANTTVKWASSNTGIATVSSSGLVIGVGGGRTVITAQYKSSKAQVTVTVVDRTLTITCPSDAVALSADGNPVAVTFSSPTTSGGVAPVTVTTSLPSGGDYAVGETIVNASAVSADGQVAQCTFKVIVQYNPTEDVTDIGPSASITCPAGAVAIPASAGTAIQTAINNNVAGTKFCLGVGTHLPSASIVPKTGNWFVGQYGAILSGASQAATTDTTQGLFRCHNQDIDNVVIKNLVITRAPSKGVHAYRDSCDSWTVESNEISYNRTGVQVGHSATVQHNYIHHNVGDLTSANAALRGGGYLTYRAHDLLFFHNEIAFNGPEQKVCVSNNAIFRENYVHHNQDGIWFDCFNYNALIEDNIVEDNTRDGIFYEISGLAIIRNNTVRRSGGNGVFVSTSRDVEVSGNTLVDNFRGINYYVNCGSVGQTTTETGVVADLLNVNSHDNTVSFGATAKSGTFASIINPSSACTTDQRTPYFNGTKQLVFEANDYDVPNTGAAVFHSNFSSKTWAQWQALGHDDPDGTIQ